MSNIFSKQDAYCICNKEGSFVFVNEFFMNLFDVTEQECYSGLKLQDFIVASHLIDIFHPFYDEIIVKNNHGQYFGAFLSTKEIKETGLFAISIRVLSENIALKRIVTSFRRYIDNQVALICLKHSTDHFLPLINFNTDFIDDNPSFIINIGNELTQSIKNTVRNFKNYSGLLKPQKLEKYQNYYAISYIFQLLVPGLQSDTEFLTETYLIAFIFPAPLLELFQDEERLKGTLLEHLGQINSPNDLSVQLLDEIRQKTMLYFDSQSIDPASALDMEIHNLEIFSKNLYGLTYLEAIDALGTFSVNNHKFEGLRIYQLSSDGLDKQYSYTPSISELENTETLSEITKIFVTERITKPIIKSRTVFYPYFNKINEVVGIIEAKTYQEEDVDKTSKIIVFLSNNISQLFNQLFQERYEMLHQLADKLLLENNIQGIFNTLKSFIVKIFRADIKVFAALDYDSETETLNFRSTYGYSPDFNVKSIGLNSKNSVVAKCGREKVVLNISDVRKCDFYLEGDSTVKSELAIPMVYNRQLIGVLNIESQIVNAFSSHYHIPLFHLVCDLATTNYVRISSIKKLSKLNLV